MLTRGQQHPAERVTVGTFQLGMGPAAIVLNEATMEKYFEPDGTVRADAVEADILAAAPGTPARWRGLLLTL